MNRRKVHFYWQIVCHGFEFVREIRIGRQAHSVFFGCYNQTALATQRIVAATDVVDILAGIVMMVGIYVYLHFGPVTLYLANKRPGITNAAEYKHRVVGLKPLQMWNRGDFGREEWFQRTVVVTREEQILRRRRVQVQGCS